MDLKLKNKVALVCAASEGLGKYAAMELACEGAKVAICSRNETKLHLAQKEISETSGTEIFTFVADLRKPEEINKLHSDLVEKIGAVDILVNNVGGPPPGSFEELTDKDWQEAINLTMMSALRMSYLVLPGMKDKKWGRIVNISSVSVKTPVTNLFLSNSIRLGVLGWAKALSDELGQHGITVNTVCPGSTRTNRIKSLFKDRSQSTGKTPEEIESLAAFEIPMKRIGEPEELAALIAFLSSERASYMTGLAIQVDGGSARSYY